MMLPANNARDVAVLALRDRAGNVTAHLDRLLGQAAFGQQEKALARELALGALRRRGTLDAVLSAFLRDPQRRLPAPLTEILHVALYQLLFLQRVPDFAAVDEAVKQASAFHHHRQAGMVNGLLRTVTRNLAGKVAGPLPPPAADLIPVAPDLAVRFLRPVLPDPRQHPAEYLAAAYSLPLDLTDRWLQRLGTDKAAEVALHAAARAPLIVRVNALAGDLEQARAALAAEGVAARPHANGASLVLEGHLNVAELRAFQSGLLQPQDPTATAVVLAAAPQPGTKVLDFCAAPGTKTTHLAERMGNRGQIVAADVSAEKLQRIEDNCRRMGVTIVQTVLAGQVAALPMGSFDLVLVDAPCSNTGVLARRAEARWRFDEPSLGDLARDQLLLAGMAGQFLRPGGRLVYSTCSIEPEENEQVARRLTQRQPALSLIHEQLTLPAGAGEEASWHDGGYVAIFQARR